ncbi:unnamed protein product, partial [Gulo gulo]
PPDVHSRYGLAPSARSWRVRRASSLWFANSTLPAKGSPLPGRGGGGMEAEFADHTWAVAHAMRGLGSPPHSAFALSGHRDLWSGWEMWSKAQVDAEGQE